MTSLISRTFLVRGWFFFDTAIALANYEYADSKVYIPFELVTPANVADFLSKN